MNVLKTEEKMDLRVAVEDIMHGYRVAELAYRIAVRMGLDPGEAKNIYAAAILHDIGKASICPGILNKRGSLTKGEEAIVHKHPCFGRQICVMVHVNSDSVAFITDHHENYNGTGYPEGKKGLSIPVGARIIKICDVYDALTMNRPYRLAFPPVKALDIMEQERDTFDPGIFEIFKEVIALENQ